jgi:hypothetical protein
VALLLNLADDLRKRIALGVDGDQSPALPHMVDKISHQKEENGDDQKPAIAIHFNENLKFRKKLRQTADSPSRIELLFHNRIVSALSQPPD